MNKTRLASRQRAFNDLTTITHAEHRGESMGEWIGRAREDYRQKSGPEVESLAPSVHVVRLPNSNLYLHRDGQFTSDVGEARSWVSRRAAESYADGLAQEGVMDSVKEKLVKARDWIKNNPKKSFAALVATGLLTGLSSEFVGQLKDDFAQGSRDGQNGVEGNAPSQRVNPYTTKVSPEGVFGVKRGEAKTPEVQEGGPGSGPHGGGGENAGQSSTPNSMSQLGGAIKGGLAKAGAVVGGLGGGLLGGLGGAAQGYASHGNLAGAIGGGLGGAAAGALGGAITGGSMGAGASYGAQRGGVGGAIMGAMGGIPGSALHAAYRSSSSVDHSEDVRESVSLVPTSPTPEYVQWLARVQRGQ